VTLLYVTFKMTIAQSHMDIWYKTVILAVVQVVHVSAKSLTTR
jgi:hypothetical protein